MRVKSYNTKTEIRDPGNLLFVLYVGLVMVLVVLAVLSDAQTAVGAEGDTDLLLAEVRQGELLFPGSKGGHYTPAPHLSEDVEIYVSGMVVRTIVRQRFQNTSERWQEALYVFPLPDEAAVDQLRMRVGERVIIGEIKEKEEAKKIYEKAKKEGKRASLLSQERPNIFTMAVANIAPGEEVEVEIEYQDVVSREGNIFSLRFPMVVGHRYIPGKSAGMQKQPEGDTRFSGSGWLVDTDQVPDASRITPPVAREDGQLRNPVRLLVELAAGFSLDSVESLYHGVTVRDGRKGIKEIRFTGQVAADRDFVLEWKTAEQRTSHAALFTEIRGDDNYLLLMLTPPDVDENAERLPREVIFVLDTSGSMTGDSIVQAKKALQLAISRLSGRDRFNVIEFNSKARSLFSHPVAAGSERRAEAIAFVEALVADGGTEIESALKLALDKSPHHNRIRQIVFLTDGCVGNEEQLLSMIANGLGDSRLFTVGIGSAPNSYFMSRAAAMGRGSFLYIGKVDEVQKKMNMLFARLEHPAVTDIVIRGSDAAGKEIHAKSVSDLYAGEPLIVSLRLPTEQTILQITGLRAGHIWQESLNIEDAAKRPGIATLWARKQIRGLMDSLSVGADKEEVRKKVVELGLTHHLVSRYTSLVAVEQQRVRPDDKTLDPAAVKTNLPHGWQAAKIFGGAARTATPATLHILLGSFLLLLAFLLLQLKRRRQ